jgi:hypothetical protein
MKTLAFFFAESARSSAASAGNRIINQTCQAQWLDYATLLRRWSYLSHMAIHAGLNDWTARGGSKESSGCSDLTCRYRRLRGRDCRRPERA